MNAPATPQDLEAARLLLSRLDVDPADLVSPATPADSTPDRQPLPTIGEWIPVAASLVSPEHGQLLRVVLEESRSRMGRPADGHHQRQRNQGPLGARAQHRPGPPKLPRRTQRSGELRRRHALPLPASGERRTTRPEPQPRLSSEAPATIRNWTR